jgi:hypothetical protein
MFTREMIHLAEVAAEVAEAEDLNITAEAFRKIVIILEEAAEQEAANRKRSLYRQSTQSRKGF